MKNFTFCLVISLVFFINPAHAVIRTVNIPFTESVGSDIRNNNLNEYIGNDKPDKIQAATQTYADDNIPNSAYQGNTSLKEIWLSPTIETTGCTESINLPDSLTCIVFGSFAGCKSLKSLVIPPSVISIGMVAFSNCTGLTSLTLQPNLQTIGPWAFAGCTGLTSLVIPSSVTTIERSAFEGCTGLKSVVFEPGIKQIGYSCFANCTSLTSVSFPTTVTSIYYRIFTGCTSLASLTIPASVNYVGEHVFENCSNLKSIYLLGPTPPNVSEYTFHNYNPETATLYVPAGSKSAYLATGWNVFGNIVELTTVLPQVEEEKVTILPNPVHDYFSIDGLPGNATLRLMDISGKVRLSQPVTAGEKISVEALTPGVYIFQLITSQGTVERKLVKK